MKKQGMEVEWKVETEMETQPLSCRSPSMTCVLMAFLFLCLGALPTSNF